MFRKRLYYGYYNPVLCQRRIVLALRKIARVMEIVKSAPNITGSKVIGHFVQSKNSLVEGFLRQSMLFLV
jgi:hypothetical protein